MTPTTNPAGRKCRCHECRQTIDRGEPVAKVNGRLTCGACADRWEWDGLRVEWVRRDFVATGGSDRVQ